VPERDGGQRTVVRAAGGVVWRPRRDGDGVEVALVHRPRYDDWSLPKGKLDAGEPAVVGACREVLEETGLRVAAGRTLGSSRYRVVQGGREVPKTVRWWALRAKGGAFAPTDEVDELRWLAPARALRLLTAGHDAAPLKLFLSEAPDTRTLLLVRHGSAGDRRSFAGDDDLRPLDPGGRAQADALANLLVPYDPARLLAAPLVRCVDTLAPLADTTGRSVEHDPLLTAPSYAADPARTVARLRSLVHDEATSVACSQGEVLPHVLSALAEGGRCPLPSAPQAPKGSVWALSFGTDGCLVDADLTADPVV
jgi:8-oxo-dGTP pyrophosphatase MutT (NUDIX family)/phosphohistidine phosphatase SixA